MNTDRILNDVSHFKTRLYNMVITENGFGSEKISDCVCVAMTLYGSQPEKLMAEVLPRVMGLPTLSLEKMRSLEVLAPAFKDFPEPDKGAMLDEALSQFRYHTKLGCRFSAGNFLSTVKYHMPEQKRRYYDNNKNIIEELSRYDAEDMSIHYLSDNKVLADHVKQSSDHISDMMNIISKDDASVNKSFSGLILNLEKGNNHNISEIADVSFMASEYQRRVETIKSNEETSNKRSAPDAVSVQLNKRQRTELGR